MFDRFNENLTRFANKGLTGNPEGLDEDGNLIGFSIDQAIRNPNAQTKTDGEIVNLMQRSGIWSETTGFNKAKAVENLRKPVGDANSIS